MSCAPENTHGRRSLVLSVVAATVIATMATTGGPATAAVPFETQSLEGSGNHLAHPNSGLGGLPYSRVAPARHADGHGVPVSGPNEHTESDGAFDDVHPSVFSAHRLPFRADDPRGTSRHDRGVTPSPRSTAAPGTEAADARVQGEAVLLPWRHARGGDLGDLLAPDTNLPGSERAADEFLADGGVPAQRCRVRNQVFPDGRSSTDDRDRTVSDDGRLSFRNVTDNATFPSGGAVGLLGVDATRDGANDSPPGRFSLDTTQCSPG